MKKLALVLVVAVVVLAGVGYWAWNSLDLIVRVAIEYYAPKVTGVAVKVGGVDISAANGRGVVRGLELGSPHGFTSPYAARVGEIRVALDSATLTEPVVRIGELTVDSPLIAYERGEHGTNLEAIRANIERYIAKSGGPSESRAAQARPGRHKFIVDRLSIRGARVTMTNPALRGQGIRFGLPDIELRGVGRKHGGLTASEVGKVVASELEARIAQRVLTNADLLRKGGVEGAIDALKGLLR